LRQDQDIRRFVHRGDAEPPVTLEIISQQTFVPGLENVER
jgi:hypothetical protein